MRGGSDFCVGESVKTSYFANRGVPAPKHADKQDSSLGSKNVFLFLSGTRIPTRRKSRTIKNVPLGFPRNPNRNRNPAPGSCPPKIGTKIGMCSLDKAAWVNLKLFIRQRGYL